jgi:hypothetical protein
MIPNQRTTSLYQTNYTRKQAFRILISSFPDWNENQKIGIINSFKSGKCSLSFISYVMNNILDFEFDQNVYKELIYFCLRLNVNFTMELVNLDRSLGKNLIPYFVEYFIINYVIQSKHNKSVTFLV